MRRPPLTSRLAGFGTSVFAEMTTLARQHGAVNLGQGYPDFDGPDFVKKAAIAALRAGHNQYAPMPGLPALQQAVADHQKRFYGLEHDPAEEVTVHAGATEALCATLAALLDPADEAIVLEPFYDAYLPGIALAQAKARVVPLAPPDLRLDGQVGTQGAGEAPADREADSLALGPLRRLESMELAEEEAAGESADGSAPRAPEEPPQRHWRLARHPSHTFPPIPFSRWV